jgi:Zn-dependent protease with chaperone function
MRPLLTLFTLWTVATVGLALGMPLSSVQAGMGDTEKRLWLRSAEEQKTIERSGFLYGDENLEGYLSEIANRVCPADASPHPTLRVRVIKNPYLNAFSFPNGVVYVHTGLLSRLDNEAQLATVLAHEAVHCVHRHALKAFTHRREEGDVRETARDDLIESDDLKRVLIRAGPATSAAGYYQDFETEADMVGIEWVFSAGYDPGEALKLFQHLEDERAWEKSAEPFLFGSHPTLQSRIANCRKFLSTHPPNRSRMTTDNEGFVSRLGQVILENARIDLKAGRFHSARCGIDKYLTVHPHEAEAFFVMGEVFRQKGEKGDGDRAITCYKKAISLEPRYADPYRAIGMILFKQGQLSLARQSFETCLSLAPHSNANAYVLSYLKRCSR